MANRMLEQGFGLLKHTVSDFAEDRCPRFAASLSYYAVFSLPPLLIVLLLLLSAVLDPDDVQRLLTGQIGTLLGPAGADQIRTIIAHAERPDLTRGGTAVLGLGALLFGAVGAFVELQNALNRIWEVAPDPRRGGVRRFIAQRLISFGMLLTVAFLLLVSLVISAALEAFAQPLDQLLPGSWSAAVLQGVTGVVSIAVITLLFALLFSYVPDAQVAWRDVWVGALVTALLFTVGKYGLSVYIAHSSPGSAFGAAGALALLLVWIYYTSSILFFGAEFTQAWAQQRGAGIRPADGAVRVLERRDFREAQPESDD